VTLRRSWSLQVDASVHVNQLTLRRTQRRHSSSKQSASGRCYPQFRFVESDAHHALQEIHRLAITSARGLDSIQRLEQVRTLQKSAPAAALS
jgi:hypothetical protein